ncbi:hypothetical protein [Segatella baroniae]|uniref:hypothetical protein n=1 Tax=Segatella baroniae TaxID=305719 RepID=UPI0012DE4F85|nr:hypothetical protein [Segatella baroniae]
MKKLTACNRKDRNLPWDVPASHLSTPAGSPTASMLPLGDPSRVDFSPMQTPRVTLLSQR